MMSSARTRPVAHASRHARHGERGQTLVEFALASLFVLALIFGIIDFGRALFAYDLVTNSARLATRWAMVHGSASCPTVIISYGGSHCNATNSDVVAYVKSISPGIDTSQFTTVTVPTTWSRPTWANAVGCNNAADQHAPGCLVTVKVSYTFNFVFRFAPITIASTSEMIIAQ